MSASNTPTDLLWVPVDDLKRGQLVEVGTHVCRVIRKIPQQARPTVLVEELRDSGGYHERYFLAPHNGLVRVVP